MKYKDAVGTDINVGDVVAYYVENYGIQLGRVLELTKTKASSWCPAGPSIKIQGARKKYWEDDPKFEKLKRPSMLYKLQNVLVINGNLPAIVTLA